MSENRTGQDRSGSCSTMQKAIKSAQSSHTIVMVAFDAGHTPILFEIEYHTENAPCTMHSELYTLIQTRKAPRQHFLMCEVITPARPVERSLSDFLEYQAYGNVVTASRLQYIWFAPHLCIAPWILEKGHVEPLTTLPPGYTLDGALQHLIANAYDGVFTWCHHCNDWESCASPEHHDHIDTILL